MQQEGTSICLCVSVFTNSEVFKFIFIDISPIPFSAGVQHEKCLCLAAGVSTGVKTHGSIEMTLDIWNSCASMWWVIHLFWRLTSARVYIM